MIVVKPPENHRFKHIVASLDASRWIVRGSIEQPGLFDKVFIVSANGKIETIPHGVHFLNKFAQVISFQEELAHDYRRTIGYLNPDGEITIKKNEAFITSHANKKQKYELLTTTYSDNSNSKMLKIILGTTLDRSHVFITDQSLFKIIQLPGNIEANRFGRKVAQLSADETTIAIMITTCDKKRKQKQIVILDNPLI